MVDDSDRRPVLDMFPRIVVPLDGSTPSETAIAPALALATRAGVRITLLHLVADETGLRAGRQYLDEFCRRSTSRLVDSAVVGSADGDGVAAEIVGEAAVDGALVCMATHGRRSVDEARLGSVAAGALRLGARPILLAGPAVDARAPTGTGPIVVALDGSPTAASMLPVTTSWARFLRLPLLLVEVDDGFRDHDPAEYLAAVAAELYGDVDTLVLRGPVVSDEFVDLATRLPAGLLAMATDGGRDRHHAALGRTTLDVVRRATCPVLVARTTTVEL